MERKEILLIALIAVLLLTTAVQAIQLVVISNNAVVTGGSKSVQAATGSTPAVSAPSSLDNLPSMVGGC
ncbi:MAG: hypothetical protein AABX34_06210 [Nanoarchaeota archaeon]